MQKKTFYTELAYALGIIALALGTALMEKSNFGVSMIVAPAYLTYLKVSQYLPFFTFGMAEYILQGLLVVLLCVVLRKFRLSYFFSFVTAVVYGIMLDGFMLIMDSFAADGMALRAVLYASGLLSCSLGVSMVFHTYIPPEAYELFVKEISKKIGMNINVFKTIFDCTCMLIGVALSFAFFGMWHFEGVKVGTVLCAFVNGPIIGGFTKLLEARFEFRDGMKLRRYFE